MNQEIFPTRRKTINQVRLETLITQYRFSVEGMTLPMLTVPNSPKGVTVNKKIFKFATVLSKENVFAFMISKYNLFPKLEQSNNEWVEFKFTPTTGLNSLMYYIDSQQFQKQRQSIALELKKAFEKDEKCFKGFEIYHFSEQFQLPKMVLINKSSLKQFFEDTNERDVESRVKKIYRGFAFFFNARYNLINATRKNRKIMKFTRNYSFDNGDRNLSLFNLQFENQSDLYNAVNYNQRKRLPSKIETQTKNDNQEKRLKIRKVQPFQLQPQPQQQQKQQQQQQKNNQIYSNPKIKRTFSLILREEQTKKELGLISPSTIEKLKNYTDTEIELVKVLAHLKYYK
ncbi:rac guanine nucleotide exchange factor jj [Anaeramoeba flamelloides]|uniref:Rac guanine nucleotide exchange factor jj n=1 Tax=Anaeramoeba flamelloides TaxID=1746091 RepID=A0ABQ8X7I5_9EUKA|nr:rac guanine nucleotide exchange factor jj [Anaeramoeba flamelloides]